MPERRKPKLNAELRTNVNTFTEAISTLGKTFGLNPHTEFWEGDLHDSLYNIGVIAAISETTLLGRLKQLYLAGNVARIVPATKEYRKEGYDYIFLCSPGIKGPTKESLSAFSKKITEVVGINTLILTREEISENV